MDHRYQLRTTGNYVSTPPSALDRCHHPRHGSLIAHADVQGDHRAAFAVPPPVAHRFRPAPNQERCLLRGFAPHQPIDDLGRRALRGAPRCGKLNGPADHSDGVQGKRDSDVLGVNGLDGRRIQESLDHLDRQPGDLDHLADPRVTYAYGHGQTTLR
jgi:hypothetical protein